MWELVKTNKMRVIYDLLEQNSVEVISVTYLVFINHDVKC